MNLDAITDTRGKRKYRVALAALAVIAGLSAFDKLDAIAAGSIGAVLALYCHANLKAKDKASTGSPTQ
jgi:hypothetical protein